MASNEFLLFGTGGGANVLSQAAWSAHAQRLSGFASGEAESAACNKAWRQATFVASCMGKIISDAGGDALDNASTTTFVAAFIDALQKTLVLTPPPGFVGYYADNTVPPGRWVAGDGQLLDRAGTYADLFGVVGTTFNTGGEPGTKFRMPDLRGVVIRGEDALRGLDPGRVFGSYQADQNKAHTHEFDIMEPDDAGGSFVASDAGGDVQATFTTDSSGGTEVRVKNIALRGFMSY